MVSYLLISQEEKYTAGMRIYATKNILLLSCNIIILYLIIFYLHVYGAQI